MTCVVAISASRGMATKALEAVEGWTQRLAQLRLRIGATLPQHK